MQNTVKRLGSQAFVYGLGYGLTRLIQFILLPVYTRYLTPADYGILALLLISGQIAIILTQAGLGSAMFREIIYVGTDRRDVESTVLSFLAVVGATIFALGYALSPALSSAMFDTADHVYLLRLVFLTSVLSVFESVLLARLRIEGRPRLYASLALARFIVGAAITIWFIVGLGRGLTGLVEATFLTAALFAAIYLGVLLRGSRWGFSTAVLRRLLGFGGPLVPANLAGISLTSADRYILQHFGTTAQVGIYSLGYNVSLIINLAVNAIQLAWPAQMFAIAREPNAERQLARTLTYYLYLVGFIALAISVFAREIVVLMATPEFYAASRVVPWICLAYLFSGIMQMTNSALTTQNRMHYSGLFASAAAVLNLGLNFWLIPRYGMMGAAWATLASYALLSIVLTAVNLRFWYIPYEYARLARIVLVGAILFWTSGHLSLDSIWLAALLKLSLLAVYPAALYLLRFYQPGELAAVARVWKSISHRDVGPR